MAIIPTRRSGGIARREPTRDPFQQMQELLGLEPMDLFRQLSTWGGEETNFVPRFEVKETKDSYVFKADLPGVREEDVDISLTGDRLTVSGKREEERREEGERYFAYERSYGTFSRSFTLPEGVNADAVRAEMKDGVLNLVLPKSPEVQPRRIRLGGGETKHKA